MYEITGTVKRIGETQRFANNFTKRELVISEPSRGGDWQNHIGFYFKRANCDELDKLSVGDEVKIGFVIDGRDWSDPNTGKIRCFTDLTALRLERVRQASAPCGNTLAVSPASSCGNTLAVSPVSDPFSETASPAVASSASSADDDDEVMPF